MSQDHLDYHCSDCDLTVHVVSYGYHGCKVYCPQCGERMEA